MDTERVAREAARGGRDPGWRRRINVIVALLVVSIAGLATWAALVFVESRQLAQAQSDAAVAAERLATQVRGLGGTPVVSPPAPVTGPAGPSGPQGPGPSQQQIDETVARYFAAHPPGPSPAMVGVAVAEYFTANPPQPGPAPTPAQIATAASDYISAHTADFVGATGRAGADATDAQVSSAVEAYCGAHNNCVGATGPAGATGAQGVQGASITDLTFQRDQNGACQVIVTLHDPATGTDSTVTHPAGEAACPLLPPPPTTRGR